VTYPAAGFGWIGIVGTLPGFGRRGIGRATTEACVEFIEASGCASVLDASTSGAPVYERLGFVDHGPTTFYRPSDGGIPPYRGGVRVAPVGPVDVVDCVELDRSAFGTDRERLITAAIEHAPAGAVIARHDGRAVGFAVTQPTLIGPVVARDPEVLHALLASIAGLGRERLCLMVPPEYLHREELGSIGFAPDRSLRHMRRGIEVLAADPSTYAGRVTLGFG
jgi:predicted N-acetyltransferase YhbS